MPKQKFTRVPRLEAEAKHIERELSKATIFADGVRTEFWKRTEDKFKAELEGIERGLDNYRKLSDYEIRDLLAGRANLRGFLGMRDFVKAKTYFENKLTVIRQRIQDERAKERERAS